MSSTPLRVLGDEREHQRRSSTMPATTAGMTPVPMRTRTRRSAWPERRRSRTPGRRPRHPSAPDPSTAGDGSSRVTRRSCEYPRPARCRQPRSSTTGISAMAPSRMRYARSIGAPSRRLHDHVDPRRDRRPGARRSATGTRRCGCGECHTPTISSPRASAARLAREHSRGASTVYVTRRRVGVAARPRLGDHARSARRRDRRGPRSRPHASSGKPVVAVADDRRGTATR